jgi:hypothetical protein
MTAPGVRSQGSTRQHTFPFQEAPDHAIVSGPVCTALMRQGRSVARAKGPRHHRPRLRHRTRRRGDASAASRPPQARARSVVTVCLSAQPLADRSVQRLIPRCRWTAPTHGWAARPRSCPPSISRAFCRSLTLLSVSVAASAGRRACQTAFSAGGPRSQALCIPGDRRRTRVPDEALALAGGPCGGNVPPRPSCVAALRGRSNGL